MSIDAMGFPKPLTSLPIVQLQGIQQTTNLSTGDHVKFSTVLYSNDSTFIVPDITSAYNNGAGASLGRVTLLAGSVYRITSYPSSLINFSVSTGFAVFVVYDVNTGQNISPSIEVVPISSNGVQIQSYSLDCIYAPKTNALIEVRIINSSSITQIGYFAGDAFDRLLPNMIIQKIG